MDSAWREARRTSPADFGPPTVSPHCGRLGLARYARNRFCADFTHLEEMASEPVFIIARLFNQAFATELAEFGAFLVRKIALGGRALWHFGRLARRCGYEAEILEQPDAIQRATKRRSIAFHGLNSDEGLHAHEHLQRNPAPLPHSPIAPLSFRLELIADLPQQSFAPRDILIAFKPLGCCTVDDPKTCPTLFRLGP